MEEHGAWSDVNDGAQRRLIYDKAFPKVMMIVARQIRRQGSARTINEREITAGPSHCGSVGIEYRHERDRARSDDARDGAFKHRSNVLGTPRC